MCGPFLIYSKTGFNLSYQLLVHQRCADQGVCLRFSLRKELNPTQEELTQVTAVLPRRY